MQRASLLLLFALSIGPPEESTDLTLQAGVGGFQYKHTGCGATDHNLYGVNTGHAHLGLHGRDGHLSYAAEISAESGNVNQASSGAAPDLNASVSRFSGNARLGGQWANGGFELGPGFGTFPSEVGRASFDTVFVPAATFWVGPPRIVYLWGNLAAGPGSPGAFAGFGHQGSLFDAQAGFGTLFTPVSSGDGGPGSAFMFALELKPHPRVRPGVDVRYQDSKNWSTGLRVVIRFGLPESEPAPGR